MPTYDFKNKETGEVHEKFMKIADKEQYLLDHPELEQVLLYCPAFGDPIRLGVKKPPSDFQKYIIGGVRDKISGSNISASKFEIPRET